ncbi:MAG TPA: adenylate/guanylate cyclase domain-containing protein [Actinomycetota bacterium]|nr:adenylate/guanylate cyclase domain-containing protein [Actinomycetota bacterium]
MTCSNCGTENPPGRKFCRECGSPLAVVCGVCGTSNPAGDKFCGECGSPLVPGSATASGSPSRTAPSVSRSAPLSERRLVSVLFADLVGFTSLSETRDPDEVRDLLSRYFDTARQIVLRYGGIVEKFIGDAVMAVWGTPVAQEDDAERAVRAALDLVQAVRSLGEELETTGLNARAGVLTGEAAVTLGAEGQGMVAGDLVNTASRIQALAEPGTVLVGEVTRRATEAAVVYEQAGEHELKGKAEPVSVSRAVRVIGGRGGALRSEGLEAPFVGRDQELRLVKDLFHTSAEERKAHLLQVIGIGGIGKSRLAWEFYKYFDGLVETYLWHRGRCLAYGEGVTYWALAEMVRGRCGIVEAEDPAQALDKLKATTADYIPDPDERAWVDPRLAHLLGLAERTAAEPEDLFSAWRLFFERLADRNPVIMVFEDVQWADGSLLDFVDYLQNWSRSHPIFVMALARPEVSERHPQWTVPRRGTTALHLEPLSEEDMRRVLQGLIPGLPEQVERQILDRAEGVPLYAVETVRMLLDRGLLAQEGAVYRLTGPVERLEVPETLHALIAARLDGLEVRERAVLQDAAVLGKTFTREALGALNGMPAAVLEPLLRALVHKEVLFVQADPRSPERGQYGFLQDLVRRVAYETLSRKERKARHLAAAENLESQWRGEEVEVVEILASHYVDAYRAAPDATDAADIKAKAFDALSRAGQRSLSLAAPHLAQGYFEQAIELTDDPGSLGLLHEQAGQAANRSVRIGAASNHYEQAIALFDQEGRSRDSARVAAAFADVAFGDGRLEEAGARMQQAFDVLSPGEPDETLANLTAQWARMLFFTGKADEAFERNEHALTLAEKLQLPEVFSQAINTKGVILAYRGRNEEALLLTREALRIALEHDLHAATLRAYNNVISISTGLERYEEVLPLLEEATEWSRRVGSRLGVVGFPLSKATLFMVLGRWDEALSLVEEHEQTVEAKDLHYVSDLLSAVAVHARRGELDQARTALERYSAFEESEEIQARWVYSVYRAVLAAAEGRPQEVLEAAGRTISMKDVFGPAALAWDALPEAVEAACSLGDVQRAEEILAELEGLYPGELTPSMRGQRERLRAKVDIAKGQHGGVERRLQNAANEFRAIPMPFWLGVTLLEHAEWLVGQDRGEEASQSLSEAVDIFERLRARPWLERAIEVRAGATAADVAGA